MSKQKISFSFIFIKTFLIISLILLTLSKEIQSVPDDDLKLFQTNEYTYTIKDNLMRTYRLIFKEDIPYYINFIIDPDSFVNSTKTIFLYSDELTYGIEICHHIAFKGSKLSEDSEDALVDYPMSVFTLNRDDDDEISNKVTIKYTPIMKGGKVNIRVQTTDDPVTLFVDKDKRTDRIHRMFHPENVIKSEYIVCISNSTEEAVMYLEQFSGKFLLNFLSNPTESHLLPLDLDKPFTPLKGHFTQLSTPYEILHIIGGDPGYMQINWISKKETGYQMMESSRALLFIKQDVEFSCILPDRTKSNEVINYEFKNLFDVDVEITVKTRDTKTFKLNGENNYQSGFTEPLSQSTKYAATFKSSKNTIVVFTTVNGDDYFQTIEDQTSSLTTKRFVFKINKSKFSSTFFLTMKFNLQKIKLSYSEGVSTKINLIPNPRRSCSTGLDRGDFYFLDLFNPYDMYNITENEFYYIAFEIDDESVSRYNFLIEKSEKTYPENIKKPLLKSDNIYIDGRNPTKILLPKLSPRPHAYSLVVYSCNYYKVSSGSFDPDEPVDEDEDENKNNKMKMDYFEYLDLFESELNDEYKVFTLPYVMDNPIISVADYIDLDYSGFLLSYHLYSPISFVYDNIPKADVLKTKIDNLRSIKYLFDQKKGVLTWTPLSSDDDETQLTVYSRRYYLCPINETEDGNEYYSNLCYVESQNIECIVSSVNEISVFNLVENTKYSFFEEVELPIKVKYYIGTYKFNQIEDSDFGRTFGKYRELIVQGKPKIEKSDNNYYFYEFNDYPLNHEGVIILKAKSSQIANEIQNNLKATVCTYGSITINEGVIDKIVQGSLGQKSSPVIGRNGNLIEIIFTKQDKKENFIVIEIENSSGYEAEIFVHGKVAQFEIYDNLMQSRNIQLGKQGIPTYVKFHLNETNFKGNKKGVYIYSDAYAKGLAEQHIWDKEVKNGFDDKLILYLNLELTVFQFRKLPDSSGKFTNSTGDTVTIKYLPLVDNININVKVQTTDLGSMFYTGNRQNRVYQVVFTFGYADPFYIASSYSDIEEGILYIAQELGTFRVECINEPSDTHILPIETDKHFRPLEGHFSKLNTHFEIYKISMIDPGFAKYYTILETSANTDIEELNGVSYFHIKNSTNQIINFPYTSKKLNIKLTLIMGESQVSCILKDSLKESSFTMNKIDKVKYFSNSTSSKITISSSTDAIISISLVEADYFPKKIDQTTGKLTDKTLIIEYPRGDYASMTLSISSSDPSFSFYELPGVERKDKYGFIPDPMKTNTYTSLESEDQKYFDLVTPYPYDLYDADMTEMYYESIVIRNDPVPSYTVTMTPKKKSTYGKYTIASGEFFWVTNPSMEIKYDSQKVYLGTPEDTLFKPKKFLMMAHSCDFKASDPFNVISLNYDEMKLWEANITSEYQFFNLTYTYHHMNMEIFFNNVVDDYNDILLSYYLYDKDTPNINVVTKEDLIKKADYFKSEKYLIEIIGDYLTWSLINDRKLTNNTNINKKYLVCHHSTNTINECQIQKILLEDASNCSYVTKNEFKLDDSMINKYLIIYQEVELPIKVRFLIGNMRYSIKEEDLKPEMTGSFAKMNSNRIYSLAQSESGRFYYDFKNFKTGTEGIIAIKASNKEVVLKAKSYKNSGSYINEELLNNAFNNGKDLQIYEDKDEGLIELIFTKPEEGADNTNYVLILELDTNAIDAKDIIIMPRGEIETTIIKDDLMLNKVFEYANINYPLYYHFTIGNFNTNKKGILVYTDDDLSTGSHVVIPGNYSDRIRSNNNNISRMNPDQEFKNYPLSAFLFRKMRNGTMPQNSVTIRLIPKVTQKSISVRVQTTNEGLIIFNGERQSRVYEVIFSNSYNTPFYIVSTTPYYSKEESQKHKEIGYLYIEQIVGKFDIKMVEKASETHILPSNEDSSFVPSSNEFDYLLGKFEILHISQINPGRAKIYFFADDGKDKLTISPNSEELIYIPGDHELSLSFDKQNENLNLRFKYVASIDDTPVSLIFNNGQEESVSSSNSVLSKDDYTGSDINLRSTTDAFLVLTTATNSFTNQYTIIKSSQSNLNNQLLLIEYPKNTEYASININIEPMTSGRENRFFAFSLMTKETGKKYVVDPLKSINRNYYGYYGENILGKNISNPYDQYNVSKDEFYYLNVKVLSPQSQSVPSYKVTIQTYKSPLPKNAMKLKNNTLAYVNKYSTNSDKTFSISNPFNIDYITPKPKALAIFVHQCNYQPNKNNSISLNYYSSDKLWNRQLKKEYQVFNVLNDYQHMNLIINKDIQNSNNNKYNDFLLSYYLYNEEEYSKIKDDNLITLKIEYLLGESFIINVNGNKLNWILTNLNTKGSTIPIKSRKYIICQIKEDDEALKYFSNNCYLEEVIHNENNKCIETNNNEIDMSNIENNKLVLIIQEVELPVKVRLFVGSYKNDTAQFDYPYYIAIGIFLVLILIAIAVLCYVCLVSKNKLNLDDLQDLGINDDKDEKIK